MHSILIIIVIGNFLVRLKRVGAYYFYFSIYERVEFHFLNAKNIINEILNKYK